MSPWAGAAPATERRWGPAVEAEGLKGGWEEGAAPAVVAELTGVPSVQISLHPRRRRRRKAERYASAQGPDRGEGSRSPRPADMSCTHRRTRLRRRRANTRRARTRRSPARTGGDGAARGQQWTSWRPSWAAGPRVAASAGAGTTRSSRPVALPGSPTPRSAAPRLLREGLRPRAARLFTEAGARGRHPAPACPAPPHAAQLPAGSTAAGPAPVRLQPGPGCPHSVPQVPFSPSAPISDHKALLFYCVCVPLLLPGPSVPVALSCPHSPGSLLFGQSLVLTRAAAPGVRRTSHQSHVLSGLGQHGGRPACLPQAT